MRFVAVSGVEMDCHILVPAVQKMIGHSIRALAIAAGGVAVAAEYIHRKTCNVQSA